MTVGGVMMRNFFQNMTTELVSTLFYFKNCKCFAFRNKLFYEANKKKKTSKKLLTIHLKFLDFFSNML
jgi:hypothetical protein